METKTKTKYKVYVWNNDADNTETVIEAPAKPTLKQLYELIGCNLVERVSGYDKSVSNRSFDIWIDEEGKFKSPVKNLRATNAWFRWMERTGHVSLPGDYITGKAVCYKKIKQSPIGCGAPSGRRFSHTLIEVPAQVAFLPSTYCLFTLVKKGVPILDLYCLI